MTGELERACERLKERIDSTIQDKETRDSVLLLVEAHENAKQVIACMRGQLERTYEMLERITSHPEFKKIMEEMKNGNEADGEA